MVNTGGNMGEQQKGNGAQLKENAPGPHPLSLEGMLNHLHEDVLYAIALARYNRFLLLCFGGVVLLTAVGVLYIITT